MVNANDFFGENDSAMIENAIKNRDTDGIVIIPRRVCSDEPHRDYWLLDNAILLPENTTVILQNCKIKLSDNCRDNFFRSINCGLGISFPEHISNIHIRGIGRCILEGADHPRATGDSSKILSSPCPYLPEDICKKADWITDDQRSPDKLSFLDVHSHSYGTDAGKEDESQHGDWRGIGILFANVDNFSIENLTIKSSHGWGISLEACTFGNISKIIFSSCMSKEIGGVLQNMENQDGINLRNGCNNIIISDISGKTGDDVIALTAIADNNFKEGGSLCSTHVMHNDWSKRETDIHDIIINNVVATSQLCWLVRLLAINTHIYNVVINNIIDTATSLNHFGTILIGEPELNDGESVPDRIYNITISNIISNGKSHAIAVKCPLRDSVISNVINVNPDCKTIEKINDSVMNNVMMNNVTL